MPTPLPMPASVPTEPDDVVRYLSRFPQNGVVVCAAGYFRLGNGVPMAAAAYMQSCHNYTRFCIMIDGDRPKELKKNAHCLKMQGDPERDWYISCYIDASTLARCSPEQLAINYAQPCFIITPWSIPREKIDTYEPKPYVRLPAGFVLDPEWVDNVAQRFKGAAGEFKLFRDVLKAGAK